MFDINFGFEDVIVSSMNAVDIDQAMLWLEGEKNLNTSELRERYLESCVSESEFFTKIKKADRLIGILKGRIEFKSNNEVWIWYYLMDEDIKNSNMDSIILTKLTKYFQKEFGISNFYTVIEDDCKMKKFWNENGFRLYRVAENFYDTENKGTKMLIFKRQ